MSSRFPNYRPSTALRQAIEALRAAEKKRRDAENAETVSPHPGQSGGPDAHAAAPGREGIDDPATAEDGASQEKHGLEPAAVDALTSGRMVDGFPGGNHSTPRRKTALIRRHNPRRIR